MPWPSAEARNEYERAQRKERRAAYFLGKTCVRCGSCDDLQIDHIDPRQKVSHRIWNWGENRRLAELEKCQVLCHPCHKVKTAEDMGWNKVHGYSRYDRGCRCDECRAGASQRIREYRARRRAAGM